MHVLYTTVFVSQLYQMHCIVLQTFFSDTLPTDCQRGPTLPWEPYLLSPSSDTPHIIYSIILYYVSVFSYHYIDREAPPFYWNLISSLLLLLLIFANNIWYNLLSHLIYHNTTDCQRGLGYLPGGHLPPPKFGHLPPPNSDISHPPKKTFARRTTATPNLFSSFFGAFLLFCFAITVHM